MNAQQARSVIGKLREVRVDRGATPGEARVAQAKAAQLEARFDFKSVPRARAAPPPRARPRPAPPVSFGGWVGGAYAVPDFDFDLRTGEHSSNVKVHHHRDRANWKIEIFPN